VDTIDVAVWGRVLQRRALKLDDSAHVLVCGALRRRFWRGPAGPVSRYEVEATSLEVLPRR
jgi:single-strand DNA-binding protein